MQSTICNPKFAIRNLHSEISNCKPKFAIQNLQSKLLNPRVEIRNVQSKTCNPKCAIQNVQSKSCNSKRKKSMIKHTLSVSFNVCFNVCFPPSQGRAGIIFPSGKRRYGRGAVVKSVSTWAFKSTSGGQRTIVIIGWGAIWPLLGRPMRTNCIQDRFVIGQGKLG